MVYCEDKGTMYTCSYSHLVIRNQFSIMNSKKFEVVAITVTVDN